jgi:hypothetical protein
MRNIKYIKKYIYISKYTKARTIPAILNRILGVVSKRYLKSTPFQNEKRYLMACSMFAPSALDNEQDNECFSLFVIVSLDLHEFT